MCIGEADRIEITNIFFQDVLSNSSLGTIYHFVAVAAPAVGIHFDATFASAQVRY